MIYYILVKEHPIINYITIIKRGLHTRGLDMTGNIHKCKHFKTYQEAQEFKRSFYIINDYKIRIKVGDDYYHIKYLH